MIKKIAAGIIICFSLLLFIIFGALSFVNYSAVTNDLTSHLGIAKENIGKIKISKFPLPYLIIELIREEGMLTLEQIKIYFSLWSLIKFNPKINKIDILDAKFYSNSNLLNIYNHEELIKNFFKYKLQNINLNVTNLSIINKQDYSVLNFDNCILKKVNALSSNYIFSTTSSYIGKISGSINKHDDTVDFSLNIDNNDYDFKLSQIYKDFKLTSGSGEYQIKNLASVIYSILPDLQHLFNKFNQNEAVNVKFNISNNEDAIELKDIVIVSSVIIGNGFVNIAKNDNITTNVKLNFPKIDLSLLLAPNAMVTFNTAPSNVRFIFADKLLKTDVTIDEIILSNNEALEKIVFSSNLLKGTLKINELSGNIKSGGVFKLTGSVTQNAVRSIFDGQLYLKHNDINLLLNILGFNDVTIKEAIPFSLESDLKLTLIDLFFKNLLLKTDNLNLSGNFSSKLIAQTPRLDATLNISSLDLRSQTYPIISPLIEFIKNLTKDMKSLDYPSKFIPIRTIGYLANLDILIDSVKYNDHIFDKINLLAKIVPSNIKISNLDFKTANNYLSTSWNLDVSNVLPSLTVEIKDGTLTTNLLSPSGMLNLRNKLVNDYSLDKAILQVFGTLSTLSHNDLILKNVKFYIANNNNLLQFNNIEAELLGGKFQGSGNILLEPYSINFVYALNTIDLGKVAALMPKKIFTTMSGAVSISGSLETNGCTLQSQLYNLTTKSQFAINNIDIHNFAIDSFIEKINTTDYKIQNLDKDINNAITTGQENIRGISGDIDLQKGIALLKKVKFTTQYSSGAASFAINIYNFDIDASSILSFYVPARLVNLNTSNMSSDKDILAHLNIKMQGSVFAPKKTFDSSDLKKILIPQTQEATNSVNY
ncbi:AsmA-like C-terminal region-containing protein [Rickettsia oklahomensis]|uniref:AsmA-like C-terminal region-containing protein n=1 Tax=Rickettsia oklahomensis TaxID=3141789 RepID=A0AAU7BXZ5_9RICK